MTGGSLPAQTWHDIMLAAHQGVEIKEIPGVGMGTKLPSSPSAAVLAANGGPKPAEIKPPPVLTKRGADILVRVEKLLDDAAKTAGEPAKPTKPVSSTSAGIHRQLCFGVARERRGLTRSAQELNVRLIFVTLLALILAAAVGLGATWVTATRGTDLGTLKIGAWTARPRTGTADVDPYSRASIARSGELPIGTGDGVAFSATTGRPQAAA